MNKPAKTDKFISEMKILFPNKFDFSKTEVINSIVPVTITCIKHQIDIISVTGELKRCKGCGQCILETNSHSPEKILNDLLKLNGNKFTYFIETIGKTKNKTKIKCNTCNNIFYQTIANHKAGRGCPKCAYNQLGKSKRLNLVEFINKSKLSDGDNLEYLSTEFNGLNYKFHFKCKKHNHEFWQTGKNRLAGSSCPLCKLDSISEKNSMTSNEFFLACKERHGELYDYTNTIFKGLNETIFYECKIHNTVEQKALYHIHKNGCKYCSFTKIGNVTRLTPEEFLEKAIHIHGDKYEYFREGMDYVNYKTVMKIWCIVHREFFNQTPEVHLKNHGCPRCGRENPKWEIELTEFIKNIGFNCNKDRTILEGREIDIYIPELKIGFELNGIYWHRDPTGNNRNRHRNKTKHASIKGVQLYQIFDDEWREKKNIVLSFIKNKLGKIENKIHARKCEIKSIDKQEYRQFMISNHILGTENSSVKLGLYYESELVCAMGFREHEKYEWNLNRFCNKADTIINGGASKLLKYFITNYNPNQIVSFSDNRFSSGNLYDSLGFVFDKEIAVNYWWTLDYNIRENKKQYRHNKKLKNFPNYNPNLTEKEIMLSNNYSYIWDCGKRRYIWNKIKSTI